MKYTIRLNPKAFNPLTRKVIESRLWEVEQCANKDSEKVIWHCAEVKIGTKPVREFYTLPKKVEPPWEMTVFGICVRGQDDAMVIDERTGHDVS